MKHAYTKTDYLKHAHIVVISLLFSACAATQGTDFTVQERYEGFNRASYDFSDSVDRTFAVPVARGYKKVVPDAVEQGITNIFLNLRSVASSANGFLQGKPGAGAEDFGRFIVNSTLGVAGIFDVASQVGLDFNNEDFGQTLAVWGWKDSTYLYVPFMGPSTWRDLPSTLIRGYIPRLVLGSAFHWSMTGADFISTRANLLALSDTRDASAIDPYAFTRDGYIQRRKFLIFDGELPMDDLFDDFDDFDDEFDENPVEELVEESDGP
ncbi:MAG: phospholipid-binding lipoprotein MlaA [Limisphaerales bacterium]|jgi:phospholipid-binding lipoprotein MlaA